MSCSIVLQHCSHRRGVEDAAEDAVTVLMLYLSIHSCTKRGSLLPSPKLPALGGHHRVYCVVPCLHFLRIPALEALVAHTVLLSRIPYGCSIT